MFTRKNYSTIPTQMGPPLRSKKHGTPKNESIPKNILARPGILFRQVWDRARACRRAPHSWITALVRGPTWRSQRRKKWRKQRKQKARWMPGCDVSENQICPKVIKWIRGIPLS